MRALAILLPLFATGCLSTKEPFREPPSQVASIPAVVSVRASEQYLAELLVGDLQAMGLFRAVYLEGDRTADYDLVAIYQPRSTPAREGFCDDRGEMVLLSLMYLSLLPFCSLDRGYEVEFQAVHSAARIRTIPKYEAVMWTGPFALPMNLSTRWHWGLPYDEVRREKLLSAILERRDAILRLLEQD